MFMAEKKRNNWEEKCIGREDEAVGDELIYGARAVVRLNFVASLRGF